jgi:hypothetical protein
MTPGVEGKAVFGASICIEIQFDGTIERLAEKLAVSLNLKEFDVEVDQYPPHKLIGSAEALGWEMWLEEESPHRFRFSMKTEDSFREQFDGNMHDLSPWFARLISIYGLNTRPTS